MKSSLSHLPEYKQSEILRIADIIREVASPEKIILFGSYATGTWVEDTYFENGIRYEYISDYDFLVVTDTAAEKEHILNDKIINRSRHLTNVAVNCLIHDLEYINEGLSFGQYFFSDIVKEGILLHDSGKGEFETPKELTPEEQRFISQRYFDQWFHRGNEFLIDAEHGYKRNSLSKAAFELHQAAENYYNTLLLVFTGYKPKTHSLEKLRQYAKPYSREILEIFPEKTDDKKETHLFDLLKRGYIDARYRHDYTVTVDELSMLLSKVTKMQQLVKSICEEKISSIS
jgi:uncharacterized protein